MEKAQRSMMGPSQPIAVRVRRDASFFLMTCLFFFLNLRPAASFSVPFRDNCARHRPDAWTRRPKTALDSLAESTDVVPTDHATSPPSARRDFVRRALSIAAAASLPVAPVLADPSAAVLADPPSPAKVTARIFLDLRGLPDGSGDASSTSRLVLGLYGDDAPGAAAQIQALCRPAGLPAPCKPLDDSRVLQREALEARKVYSSCMAGEADGVTYDYGLVWRVDAGRRVDVGSVTGKFVSREPPKFSGSNGLRHEVGTVSVRRGGGDGFGLTIVPPLGEGMKEEDVRATREALDENYIVVGTVLEGMDVLEQLSNLPVVKSFGNGKAGDGGPSRACRYGGKELYCNELKPLKKVTIVASGVL